MLQSFLKSHTACDACPAPPPEPIMKSRPPFSRTARTDSATLSICFVSNWLITVLQHLRKSSVKFIGFFLPLESLSYLFSHYPERPLCQAMNSRINYCFTLSAQPTTNQAGTTDKLKNTEGKCNLPHMPKCNKQSRRENGPSSKESFLIVSLPGLRVLLCR